MTSRAVNQDSQSIARVDTERELAALVSRFFAAVSFESGGRPDYEAIRALFIDEGILVKNISDVPEISDIDGFIRPRQAMVDSGELTQFFEAERSDVTEVFGKVAHRFSVYEKRGVTNGVTAAALGMVSTQFIRTATGWRITAMVWDDEHPGQVIPDRYR
jgi:hypothetical protein